MINNPPDPDGPETNFERAFRELAETLPPIQWEPRDGRPVIVIDRTRPADTPIIVDESK